MEFFLHLHFDADSNYKKTSMFHCCNCLEQIVYTMEPYTSGDYRVNKASILLATIAEM